MTNSLTRKKILGIYARGIAMGAADVVPGVSGGTVAFITGIYEELLQSIRSINPSAIRLLFRQGVGPCWNYINGSFLLVLLLGILTSVVSLARIISYLLATHPLLVWSFFFGLIAASSVHMARQISEWRYTTVIALLAGALIAYAVGELKPSEISASLPMVFISGAIAICAMILPGISGSFILVLLGMYGHILSAVKELNLLLIMVFAGGCGVGLLSFSHILSWLFSRFHNLTLSLLTGFLIGSLNLVWPWKHTLSFYQGRGGKQLALEQENVLPMVFQAVTGHDPSTVLCVSLMLAGLVLVILLEKLGNMAR